MLLVLIVLPRLPVLSELPEVLPEGGDPLPSEPPLGGDEVLLLVGLLLVLPMGDGLLVVPVEPPCPVPLLLVSPPVPVDPISLLLMGELPGELPVLPVGDGDEVLPTPAGPALADCALALISPPPAPPAGGDPPELPPSPSPNRARQKDDPPPGGDDDEEEVEDVLNPSVSVPNTSPSPAFGSLGLDSNGSAVGAVATSASLPATGRVVSARGRDTIDAWVEVS